MGKVCGFFYSVNVQIEGLADRQILPKPRKLQKDKP